MIEILLIDHHISFRTALKNFLNLQPSFKVIGECTDKEELLPFLKLNSIDIVIMDIEKPIIRSLNMIKLLKEEYPEIKIIILTSLEEVFFKDQMYSSGVDLLLSKYEEPGTIASQIQRCELMKNSHI